MKNWCMVQGFLLSHTDIEPEFKGLILFKLHVFLGPPMGYLFCSNALLKKMACSPNPIFFVS